MPFSVSCIIPWSYEFYNSIVKKTNYEFYHYIIEKMSVYIYIYKMCVYVGACVYSDNTAEWSLRPRDRTKGWEVPELLQTSKLFVIR